MDNQNVAYGKILAARVLDTKMGKADKEATLRVIRTIERSEGVELLGNYNG